MGWTTPKTWNPGAIVTAADLNEQLRDNLLYLLDPNYVQASKTDADISITGTSYANIHATFNQALVTKGGRILAIARMYTAVSGTPAGSANIRLAAGGSYSDPVVIAHGGGSAVERDPVTLFWMFTGLTPGSINVSIQAQVSNASITLSLQALTAGPITMLALAQ